MVFGKKNKAPEVKPATKPKLEPYEIRVMPPKFHQFLTPKSSGLGKWALIGALGLLIIAGISYGAFYLYTQLNQPSQPQPQVNVNQPVSNVNSIENLNTNANTNANANVNTNENLNVNANANANTNLNINENTNLNTNTSALPAEIPYFSSQDADNDNLTDVEEDLYSTEKRKPDTDNDGFLDGQEIANGFNPKAAGNSLLATSGLVNIYSNPTFNYEILYPKDWLARPTDQSMREVIFQSSTGEYCEVIVEDNLNQSSLVEWYAAKSPQTDLAQLERHTNKNGFDQLSSPDKLTHYLMNSQDKSKVYVITYNIGTKTSVNFLTTYAMMLNSFKLVTAVPSPSPSSAASPSEEASPEESASPATSQ
jgi:hypothetical protein